MKLESTVFLRKASRCATWLGRAQVIAMRRKAARTFALALRALTSRTYVERQFLGAIR